MYVYLYLFLYICLSLLLVLCLQGMQLAVSGDSDYNQDLNDFPLSLETSPAFSWCNIPHAYRHYLFFINRCHVGNWLSLHLDKQCLNICKVRSTVSPSRFGRKKASWFASTSYWLPTALAPPLPMHPTSHCCLSHSLCLLTKIYKPRNLGSWVKKIKSITILRYTW